MWDEYCRGGVAGRKVMWLSGNSKGIHMSWWHGECRWRMWGCCDSQHKMWVVKFRECGELLFGRFLLRLNDAVYWSYVRPAILYGCDAWCLKESDVAILWRTERSMVRAMCGVQLKDRKTSRDLMFILALNETIDQLAIVSSVHWYGHVLKREGGHVLWRALDFKVEGQRKKGRPKRTWKKQVDEESMKIGLRMQDALCRSKWSVGVNQIAIRLRWVWPPSLVGILPYFKHWCLSLSLSCCATTLAVLRELTKIDFMSVCIWNQWWLVSPSFSNIYHAW